MHAHRSAFVALALLLPALGAAQPPELTIPALTALQRDAIESVNITLGPVALGLIRFMSHFDGEHDPEAQSVLQGLHMVQVHSFEFTTEGGPPQEDVEALRSELAAPGWNHLVEVRNPREQKNVDIYLSVEDGRANGMVVIASEPHKFTIVNIAGYIDLQRLHRLEGQFGIPKVQQPDDQ